MSQAVSFGIVGGYGATGKVVASQLHKSCTGEILVGGRDLAKAKALAAEFGQRVSAVHLDVLDARSLDEFCSRCSIIVNCGGPVRVLQDRVAQAALRNRCHYVDAAGLSIVKERLLPHAQEIADLGLSFVVSAGWMPGLTEVLPVYVNAQARAKMETIESLTVYFADSGEWSSNALSDGVWYIRHLGLRRPGYFSRGEWTRVKASAAFRKVDLGSPVGRGRFCMFSQVEQEEIGRGLKDCDFFTYTYLSGLRSAISATLMALLPLPEGLSIRLLRNVFRRNRFPVGGFVVAQVIGRSQGRRLCLTGQIVFNKHRDYWINGLALATVARMIADGRGVKPGVHFVADAVDSAILIAELRKGGIELTEKLEPCE